MKIGIEITATKDGEEWPSLRGGTVIEFTQPATNGDIERAIQYIESEFRRTLKLCGYSGQGGGLNDENVRAAVRV